MPRRGVEPPSPCEHWHLKPACLPFHHLGEPNAGRRSRPAAFLPNYTGCGTICQGRSDVFLKQVRRNRFRPDFEPRKSANRARGVKIDPDGDAERGGRQDLSRGRVSPRCRQPSLADLHGRGRQRHQRRAGLSDAGRPGRSPPAFSAASGAHRGARAAAARASRPIWCACRARRGSASPRSIRPPAHRPRSTRAAPRSPPQEIQKLFDRVTRLLSQETFSFVVLSGSLPPGAPPTLYAELIDLARQEDAGRAGYQRRAAAGRIAGPPLDGQAEPDGTGSLAGRPLSNRRTALQAAQELLRSGIEMVVADARRGGRAAGQRRRAPGTLCRRRSNLPARSLPAIRFWRPFSGAGQQASRPRPGLRPAVGDRRRRGQCRRDRRGFLHPRIDPDAGAPHRSPTDRLKRYRGE